MDVLDVSYLNNTVLQWIIAVALAAVSYIVLQAVKIFLARRLGKLAERTASQVDDILVHVLRRTNAFVILIVSLYFGSLFLTLPDNVAQIVKIVVTVVFFLQVALWGTSLVDAVISRTQKIRREEDPGSVSAFGAVSFFARVVIWSLVAFLILDNFGIDLRVVRLELFQNRDTLFTSERSVGSLQCL